MNGYVIPGGLQVIDVFQAQYTAAFPGLHHKAVGMRLGHDRSGPSIVLIGADQDDEADIDLDVFLILDDQVADERLAPHIVAIIHRVPRNSQRHHQGEMAEREEDTADCMTDDLSRPFRKGQRQLFQPLDQEWHHDQHRESACDLFRNQPEPVQADARLFTR